MAAVDIILPAPQPLPATLTHPKHGKPSAIWRYHNAGGELLFAVARFDPPGARKEILPLTCGADGWRWRAPPAPRPLYGLDRLAAHPDAPVLVVEGEKAADAAAIIFPDFVAIAWHGGAQALTKADWSALQGRRVTIWPDNDQPGFRAATSAAQAATAAGAANVAIVSVPEHWPQKWDLADALPEGATADTLRELLTIAKSETVSPADKLRADIAEAATRQFSAAAPPQSPEPERDDAPRFKTLTAGELLRLELPPREYALEPILPCPGLAMIYASRGLGKTYLALSISHAIASGSRALRWDAPKPLRVLHFDGEMPAPALQERLAQIVAGSGVAPPDENRLRFVIGDLAADGLPNIAAPDGMNAIEQAAADADVILLDNLSTLAAGMRENEADDWGVFQAWLMRMRRAGKLVIIIHHAGKGGNQRGTSRREDALDTVIALRRPQDYNPEEGARFELHIEKARGAMGAAVAPFEARLMGGQGGGLTWAITDLQTAQNDRAIALLTDGLSLRQVAEAVGMSKSAVGRLKAAQGL